MALGTAGSGCCVQPAGENLSPGRLTGRRPPQPASVGGATAGRTRVRPGARQTWGRPAPHVRANRRPLRRTGPHGRSCSPPCTDHIGRGPPVSYGGWRCALWALSPCCWAHRRWWQWPRYRPTPVRTPPSAAGRPGTRSRSPGATPTAGARRPARRNPHPRPPLRRLLFLRRPVPRPRPHPRRLHHRNRRRHRLRPRSRRLRRRHRGRRLPLLPPARPSRRRSPACAPSRRLRRPRPACVFRRTASPTCNGSPEAARHWSP